MRTMYVLLAIVVCLVYGVEADAQECASCRRVTFATVVAPAPPAPAKQWVLLVSQSSVGYGSQRADGLWQIDAGTKRPAPREDYAAVRLPAPADAPGAAYAATPFVGTALAALSGLEGQINAVRASAGLPALAVDATLVYWAQVNNSHQQARGMGHHVMGTARRQNAAMASGSQVVAMWMASPGHRAAILDPTIRWMGVAGLGAYWTFNGR